MSRALQRSSLSSNMAEVRSDQVFVAARRRRPERKRREAGPGWSAHQEMAAARRVLLHSSLR